MGASIAKSTISSMVNNSIDVINSYSQICTATAGDQNSGINLDGCTIGEGGKVVVKNTQYLQQQCITNATTQVAIASSVNQAMRQQANSVIQQFAFGTIADAENFINASITLADQISNVYNSECALASSKQTSTINCKNSTINGVIEVENYENITQTCILNAITKSEAYQNAITKFEQSAVAKQQATFVYILLAFGLILAVGAYFLIGIANTPEVQWLIVGIVLFSVISTVIYAITARSSGNYPYRKA